MGKINGSRREFLRRSIYLGAFAAGGTAWQRALAAAGERSDGRMRFGLVTYQWGRDWDLATLIANCEKANLLGVELRTGHAHKVEANLSGEQRQDVKKRFADSAVTLVGLGTNFAFHHPEPSKLKKEIEATKQYVVLSYDVGGFGVKVKPNDLPAGVPKEKTIDQIGMSLNEIGKFAADYGQRIRLEVHGSCSPLPVMKAIMDVVDRPNVGLCWNCNDEDLQDPGLEYNFNLVKARFGDTVHVRELNIGDYPYQELMNLLVGMDYTRWVLLEARTEPPDRAAALIEQRHVWDDMLATARTGKKVSEKPGVQVTQLEDRVRVEIGGSLFTEYWFKDVPRPYFYPVIGPTGEPVIRHWPMKEVEQENDQSERDHPHHRSLWFAHGDVNGVDFWTDGTGKGKIVHQEFTEIGSGPTGIVTSVNKWLAADGKEICKDMRRHRFHDGPDGPIMDFEIMILASNGDVIFGDTKEGSMAIRVAPTMKVEGKLGKGHIVNSEGVHDGEAWGKRAAWCDYYGPVKDQTVGVAIFDHPENPRHPTWWHVRTYGLFAANPFGIHDFEGKPADTGDFVIEAGKSTTFKYRFYFHKGDEKEGKVAERYKEYVATTKGIGQ
jgi:sugar phosphate isomerase/epimerase